MGFGRILFLTGLIGLGLAGTASASPITFTVSGIFDNASTLTGTLVIDTASGVVNSGDLTVSGVGEFNNLTASGFLVSNFDSLGDNFWFGIDLTESPAQSDPYIQLGLLLGTNSSLIGYAGSALCGDADVNCGGFESNYSLVPLQS